MPTLTNVKTKKEHSTLGMTKISRSDFITSGELNEISLIFSVWNPKRAISCWSGRGGTKSHLHGSPDRLHSGFYSECSSGGGDGPERLSRTNQLSVIMVFRTIAAPSRQSSASPFLASISLWLLIAGGRCSFSDFPRSGLHRQHCSRWRSQRLPQFASWM